MYKGIFIIILDMIEDALKPVKKEKGKKLIKADREKKVVLPKGVSKNTIKEFLNSIKPQEDPEDARRTNRDGKKYEYYGVYFSMGDNTLQVATGENGNLGVENWGSSRDLGYMIWEEIGVHGRKTIDELAQIITSVNINLLTLVVNQMIKDDLLMNYKEEDGTETLERVDMEEQNRRHNERLGLEDKTVNYEPDEDSML